MDDIQVWQEENPLYRLLSNKYLQAAISYIPQAGGPAQVILSAYVQERKERRWKIYWESIVQRVLELGQEKIDTSYFETEDFVERFCNILDEVGRSADEEKLKYLRDYFVGYIWRSGPRVEWKDLFFQYLVKCSGAHLGVLESFYSTQSQLSLVDRFSLPERTEKCPLTISAIHSLIPTFDTQLIEILINDIESFGLVKAWLGKPVEPRGWSISNAGLLFMQFLRIEWGL